MVAECSHSLVSWLLYSHLYLDEAVTLESHEPIRLTETDDPPLGECLLQSLSEIGKIESLVTLIYGNPAVVRLLTQGCVVVCGCVLQYM